MSSNQCPACQQEAMDAMTKLMKRPHLCRNCGVELRMNLVFSTILSLVYFALVVRTLIFTGINGQGILYVLLMTGVFITACLFVPLERKQRQGTA